MKKVILITGCSSGIGRASARLFAPQGWQVVATMRDTADAGDLAGLPNVDVLALDVSAPAAIAAAFATVASRYGRLDAVVNNAGFGAFGPFETASRDLIARQLATNLTGMMDVTRAALPMMRARRSGTIVNIASIGGLVTMPLNAIYHATKYAVVGFTEGLTYELAPFNIRARYVAPGGVATDFAGRSLSTTFDGNDHPYAGTVDKVLAAFRQRSGSYATPEQIAQVVLQAVTDEGAQVAYVAGDDALALQAARAQLGEQGYLHMMEQRFGLAG
jgi:NAD(P)-dependent dehydrogenase (short-subunit alcohol dehydrogenase family)